MKTNACKLAMIPALAILAVAGVGSASANSDNSTLGVQQLHTSKAMLMQDIQQNMQIFTIAAQKYAFENTGSAPWNQTDSATPIAYAPFLLYAGDASSPQAAASACGFTSASGTAVPGFSSPVSIEGSVTTVPSANSVSWTSPTQVLPTKWNPAFKGTYCAVVSLNAPSAQQASMISYYVAPNGTVSHALNIQMAPSGVAYKGVVNLSQAPIAKQGFAPIWKQGQDAGLQATTTSWMSSDGTTTMSSSISSSTSSMTGSMSGGSSGMSGGGSAAMSSSTGGY